MNAINIKLNIGGIAWKAYNYLDQNEIYVFGNKSSRNSIYMLLVTVIALYGNLTQNRLYRITGLPFRELFKYIDSLQLHYNFVDVQRVNNTDCIGMNYTTSEYSLSSLFLQSLYTRKQKSDFTDNISDYNKEIFINMLKNMKYHIKILKSNLELENNGEFKLFRALLNPLLGRPIRFDDYKKLSKLGYMRYDTNTKELRLNKLAYLKDWIGADVI